MAALDLGPGIHSAAELRGDVSLSADVVIVGSGSAGAVLASELAEAGQRVVVLEEGPHFPAERYQKMRPSEHMRSLWRDAGMTFAWGVGDSPVINVTMGRCVGGSSLLTGGVCFRIPEHVLHVWRHERGLADMTPERMEPCHEAVEKMIQVEEVPEPMRSPSTGLFAKGAAQLGYTVKPTRRNMRGCKGFSRCNFGCPNGAKVSVDLTYLPKAIRHGAAVYADCLVERITTQGGRAAGVTGRILNGPLGKAGGKLSVSARRVIVAAGGYHSPLLLQASGVGRKSGQVGRNLTLHPGVRVMARFDEPVNGWRGALQSAYSDSLESERVTMMSVFTPPGVLAATMPGVGEDHRARAELIPHLAMFGGFVHDEGGGVVRKAPVREPLVTYRLAAQDRAALSRAIRAIGECFFAAGAKQVFLPVLGSEPVDADGLRTYELDRVPARRLECSSQHPLGSCRMGAQPESSVVDPDGEAWDLKELFVVDGSILPTSLGVNPQVSILSMATRIAWKLRERPLPAD